MKLYEKKALHQSHLDFIIACLDNNVIPKGLIIKKVPFVANELDFRRSLLTRWNKTLRKVSQLLLKHLKHYHRSLVRYFSDEIRKEEARLQGKVDFAERKSIIHHSSNKVFQRHQRKKQKKLGSLIANRRDTRPVRKKRTSNNKTNRQQHQASHSINNGADNTVVNLSTVQLSADEISLLSKGLGFCPTPTRLDTFEVKRDLTQFTRRLRLKEYFYNIDDEDEEDRGYVPLRRSSKWTPPVNRDVALETYIKGITQDIDEELRRRPKFCHHNLTKDQRKALVSLRSRTDIVIKKADKGSATVVMSRENYIAKVMQHLNDHQHYEKLSGDPTALFEREIKHFLEDMESRLSIDKSTMASLIPQKSKASRFYILPKIHKPGNPGRPIVSSCGAPTEGISHFVDYHLAPLVKNVPSYIKDTTDFLNKLQTISNVPPGTLLVTLDVKSLYTNIPHSEGVVACRSALNTRQVLQPPTEDLIQLITYILTKNNFVFQGEHYLQLQGTAMGTRMAPSYANIFMGALEEKVLSDVDKKPDVWWRYIDDVFVIWTHGEECLIEFVNQINKMHTKIQFTAEWSSRSIAFLDVNVSIDGGRIVTDLFSKPTDTHQFLHRRSCHPRHCKSTIAYSQALRMRRICSEDDLYQKRTKELENYLVNRGYDRVEVQHQINRATRISRTEALGTSEVRTMKRVPLVVTFHPQLPRLGKILRDHLPTLHISNKMKEAVPSPPLVANRRPKNLKDLLVRASLKPPLQRHEGSTRCGRPRCKSCMHIKTGITFKSAVTGENFRAKVTANCKTSNLIYLIECRKCNKQYVGETENPLHLRMNGHRSDYYRKLSDKPVAEHFNTIGHTFEDLTIMVIEQIHMTDSARRKQRESFWIHTLRTLAPDGLNLDA